MDETEELTTLMSSRILLHAISKGLLEHRHANVLCTMLNYDPRMRPSAMDLIKYFDHL